MGIIKTEYKYTQLNITGNEIIDRETGEAFDISNAVILKKTETGKISIHYASFIYLNIEKHYFCILEEAHLFPPYVL